MFNTLFYFSAIMVYAFIALLCFILGFIVVYISHKIYILLSDNLSIVSVMDLSSINSTRKEVPQIRRQETENIAEKFTKVSNRFEARDMLAESYTFSRNNKKTALKTIISLGPTYLASVHFKAEQTSSGKLVRKKLVRYFDQLSAIPMGNVMKKCSEVCLPAIRSVNSQQGEPKTESSSLPSPAQSVDENN